MGASELFRPIVRLGKTVLRFFLPPMDQKPLYDCIPQDQHNENRSAHNWHRDISKDMAKPYDRDNITISKAQWFKDTKGLQHEFLVFTINVGEPEHKTIVRVDRYTTQEVIYAALVGDGALDMIPEEILLGMTEAEKKALKTKIRGRLQGELQCITLRAQQASAQAKLFTKTSSHRSSPSSQKLTNEYASIDRVARMDLKGDEPEDVLSSQLLQTFTFPNEKFYLRDLGLMLRDIHYLHPAYTLREHNCYWFARSLVDVFMAMKHPISTAPDNTVSQPGALRMAHRMHYNIIKPNPAEVAGMVSRIETAIEEDDKLIEHKWTEGAGGKAIEHARAEAEHARAEAEHARAEEERATAEAERATAEAERARADAERARAEASQGKLVNTQEALEQERRDKERVIRELEELRAEMAAMKATSR